MPLCGRAIPATETGSLGARLWASLGPDHVPHRLELARELLELAHRLDDPRIALDGYESLFGAHLILGDMAAADRALAEYARIAEELRQPIYRFMSSFVRGSRAVCAGRFEEAECLFHEARAHGRGTVGYADIIFAGQMYWLHFQRGDVERMVSVSWNGFPPCWSGVLASLRSPSSAGLPLPDRRAPREAAARAGRSLQCVAFRLHTEAAVAAHGRAGGIPVGYGGCMSSPAMTEAIVPKPADLTLSSGSLQSARLPWSTLLTFSAPMLGIGFMGMFTGMYLMKFSTDVLGISPAAMGVIFFVSRIWDAISDPLVGFLSDRTRSRLGRRRPWMIAGALPVGIVFVLMWTPPELSAGALPVWMGLMVVLFYTATTVFGMPHDSLGAELSTDYHDRTRIFAVRRIAFGFGAAIVLLAVARLAESPTPRAEAFSLAAVAAIVTSLLMLYTGSAMRERPEYQGRGAANPLAAVRDILANPHARILLGVFLIQQLAVGGITVMAAYHAQYVMDRPEALSMVLGAFFLVSIVSIPLWMALARHFDKKPLLVASMIMSAVAMGSIFFVEEGSLVVMLTLAGLGGFSSGGADVVFPSLEADVIDYDEYRTGERKEGMYFAAWHFAAKTAIGGAAMLTGFVLAASGFEPNVAQAESARFAIRALMSLFPLVCFGIGVLLFLRFRLTREAHAEIRAALDERRTSGQPVGPRPLQ